MRTLFFVLMCQCALAQGVFPLPYTPSSNITAMAESDSFVYVAGPQSWYQPLRYAVLFDSKTRQILPCSLRPDGAIRQIVSVGEHGFFIAGDFENINGRAYDRLAKLHPDFSLDTAWTMPGWGIEGWPVIPKLSETDYLEIASDGNGFLFLLEHFESPFSGMRGNDYRIDTDFKVLDIKNNKLIESSRLPSISHLLHTDKTGVYISTCTHPNKLLANAPVRDSIFHYHPKTSDFQLVFRVSHFNHYSNIDYCINDGTLHAIGDFKKSPDGEDAYDWLCIDIKTKKNNVELQQAIKQHLQGEELKKWQFAYHNFSQRLLLQGDYYNENEKKMLEWLPNKAVFKPRTDAIHTFYTDQKDEVYWGGEKLFSSREIGSDDQYQIENANGKTLLVGSFWGINSMETGQIARFRKSNWQLDTAWKTSCDNSIHHLYIINKKLYVVGWLKNINGKERPGMACFDRIDAAESPMLTDFADGYKDKVDIRLTAWDDTYLYFYEYGYDKKNELRVAFCRLPHTENNLNKLERQLLHMNIRQVLLVNGSFWSIKHYPNYDFFKATRFEDIGKNEELKMRTGYLMASAKVWEDDRYLYWITDINQQQRILRLDVKTEKTDTFEIRNARGGFLQNGFFYAPLHGGYHNKNVPMLRYNFDTKQDEYFVFCDNFESFGGLEVINQLVSFSGEQVLLQSNFQQLNGQYVSCPQVLINTSLLDIYTPLLINNNVDESIDLPQVFIKNDRNELLFCYQELLSFRYNLDIISVADGKLWYSKTDLPSNELLRHSTANLPSGKYRLRLHSDKEHPTVDIEAGTVKTEIQKIDLHYIFEK